MYSYKLTFSMADIQEISRDELKQWMDEDKDFVLLDVLPPDSYRERHLPGAKNVPLKGGDVDFLEKAGELVSEKDKTVVVYCMSFSCQLSPAAAEKLMEAGYTNVYDYRGGIKDWQGGELPLEGTEGTQEAPEQCEFC